MKLTEKFEFIKNKPARNRIVMPPMDTLMAEDGFANEFHIQHYGARAYGGVGTIIVESTAVLENGKIREKDLGIWKDEQIEKLTQITNIIKKGGAIAGIQLNHAGSKADLSIPTVGATLKYDYMDQSKLTLLNESNLDQIKTAFIQGANRAKKAGFDFVELHAAHGYLLSELISEQLNEVIKSSDILVRAKIIIDIVDEIIDNIGIPVGIRFSITDHEKNGMEVKDFLPLLKVLENKVVYFHISSGEVISRPNIAEVIKKAGTKLFRVPLAAQIKEQIKTPLIVVGNFNNLEDINFAMNYEIDGVAVGREIIYNPNLVINSLITSEEMDDVSYNWNDNLWFNYKPYKKLKEKMSTTTYIKNN
ncbi:oxidoreductase [Spiroplasma culicicola]|uniref:NADH:flavin oxidoreductase/NADH oxidase n=1 Tax=Spiroplasma culicicola AES-1 TaxID=1276246 RepID=W6AHS9_9MOLU|nr:tRNA-dihydrouridine synthase [Spiroplasma culicicola]AHI53244.1 NADH:flavin oxidoreductase/NADH oxidase [Spiroplasma culicicola AES-1]